MLLPNESVLYANYVANYYSYILNSEYKNKKSSNGLTLDEHKDERYYFLTNKYDHANKISQHINKIWLKTKKHKEYRKNTDYGYRIKLIKIEKEIIANYDLLEKEEFLSIFKSKIN